jgi:4-amino-4-deoxy-L-arabinose transferase-like glycosyltransferase
MSDTTASPSILRGKITATDHALGLGTGAAYFIWLYRTAYTLGFCRDESFYFHAAGTYAAWFRKLAENRQVAMQQAVIDSHWATNHEHPSLVKSLFAFSWMFLHDKWKLIEHPSQALRVPGMLFAGLALYITFLFGCRIHSRIAGLSGAFALALMPRVFYHSHLACFDVPVMAMWALALWAYLEATERRTLGAAIWAGLAYGLLLETKHNAWILPGIVVPHAFWVYGLASRGRPLRERLPLPILTMATLGPLVFYALWPWMWHDTQARVREYVAFHTNHEYYNIEFLGQNYYGPPSPPSYAPVMIGATVPTVTLVLAMLGLAQFGPEVRFLLRSLRTGAPPDAEAEARAGRFLLVVASFCGAIAVFFLPKTPIFGGTKHWLTAYPFLATLAGVGFSRCATVLSDWAGSSSTLHNRFLARLHAITARLVDHRLLLPLLGIVVFAAPALETAHSHPFGLSSYVALVGGTRGGAELGLNRQFWGFTTQGLAPYLAAHAKPGENVFIHDTTAGAWQALQNEKRIRNDLGGSIWSMQDTQWAFVHHELHMIETESNIWTVYGSTTPAHVLTHDGVPIITLYHRQP